MRRDGMVVAWRAWRVVGRAHQADPRIDGTATVPFARRWWPDDVVWTVALTSVFHDTIWPVTGGLRAAACGPHPAPCPDGTCGVYAARAAVDVLDRQGGHVDRRLWTAGMFVAGQVGLWGRVVEHEWGWRGEQARPLTVARLWQGTEPEGVSWVRRRYGLPLVEPDGDVATLVAEGARDADR